MRPSRVSVGRDKSSIPCVSVCANNGGNEVSNIAIFRIIFSNFENLFFRKGDGRLSVRIEFALGVKIGPVSRTIFSHIWWIAIYFLKGVPEFGHVFKSIFWPHRRP